LHSRQILVGWSTGKKQRGEVYHTHKKRNTYIVLACKLEGKRPIGRPKRRCEDNIKFDVKNTMGLNWTHLI
jgi:hypothetical protein